MIKCIAINDEPPVLDLVKGHIEKTEELELLAVFNDLIEGLAFIQKEKVPLLFLDINMPGYKSHLHFCLSRICFRELSSRHIRLST